MFQCPRCHYETIKKHDLKCHFYRKKPCTPIYSTVTQRILKEKIKKKDAFKINEDNTPEIHNSTLEIHNNTHEIHNNTREIHNNTHEIHNNAHLNNLNNNIEVSNEKVELKRYQCKYCLKILSRSDSLKRHLDKCTEKNKNDENTKLKIYNEQLQKEIYRLQTELQNALSVKGNNNNNKNIKPSIVNNYYTQNNIQTNNNIKINAFREENTDYLTPEYIMGIAKRGMYYAIPKLIEKIYFNENHPENQNVKITNEKSKYGEIFDGTRFIKCAKNLIVKDMICVSIDIIDDICCSLDMPIPYQEFSRKYNNNDRFLMNSLYKKAEGIALTYSKF